MQNETIQTETIQTTETEKLASIIESLLFVTEKPLTVQRLKELLDVQEAQQIRDAIELLRESYKQNIRGITIADVAGGYQLRTLPDNAQWVLALNQARPQKLSRAALESLAIIAYKQPLTRPEVEAIRGVDCGGVLKTLLDKDLIKIMGKKEEPGNPLVYGTTETFLSFFGIKSLRELPSLKEYSDLRDANESLTLDDFAKTVDAGLPSDEDTVEETVKVEDASA